MRRDFGLKRNHFEMFRRCWNESDDARREYVWPIVVIVISTIALLAIGILIA